MPGAKQRSQLPKGSSEVLLGGGDISDSLDQLAKIREDVVRPCGITGREVLELDDASEE